MFGKLIHSFTQLMRYWNFRALLAATVCWFCVFSAGLMPGAIAHSKGQSYIYFQVGETTLTTHAVAPIQDLNELLNLGLPTDKVSESDIAPFFETIRTYVDQHMDVQCPPQNCTLTYKNSDLENTHAGQYVQLYYDIGGFQTMPEALEVTYDVILADRPEFTNLLLVDQNWKTGTFDEEANVIATYNRAGETRTLDLTSGGLVQGFLAIVGLGVEHIVEGIDHVLFLIALLLPSVMRRRDGKWQPIGKFSSAFGHIIKIATAFTVAHSITLGLATLGIVDLPSRLVESIIAVSIGLAALDIFYPIFRRRIWLVIFVFGLFHGFGFASVLADLGVTSQNALLSLFAFNLGVELGQLAIIAVVFPLLYLARKQFFYPNFVLKSGGALLGAMSLYWFIERAFDINIRILPFFQGLMA